MPFRESRNTLSWLGFASFKFIDTEALLSVSNDKVNLESRVTTPNLLAFKRNWHERQKKKQTTCLIVYISSHSLVTLMKWSAKGTVKIILILYRGTQRQFSGKYLFGRRFENQNFRNIRCKISCLPASPRIFEHLQNGIITHFKRIFTLKKAT